MSAARLVDAAAALRRSRALLRHDGWSAEQLQARRSERLAELVRHARSRSAFYRDLYRDVDDDAIELERLPVVTKAQLMEHFDDVVTDPLVRLRDLEAHLEATTRDELFLGRYRVHATGGSTGRRGVFVSDRDEWREYLAGLLRINEHMGLRPRLPRRRRVATVAAARPAHVTFRMSRSLDVGLHRLLRLDATAPVDRLVDALNRHRPEFLYGYPSILELLAAEQLEGRLRIAPTTLVSSGETHADDVTRAIRAAWDVPWFQLYATTEAPVLAAHCDRHAGLHVFEDLVIVEVVDEHDRPAPPGQPGHRLLLTNLVARAQPLIRYAVSDLVTTGTAPCPCGRPYPLLRAVEGRSDDIVRLPAAGGGRVAVHPLALRSPLAAVPGLKQYRIVYDERRLSVSAALRAGVAPDPARAAIATALRDRLAAAGALPVEVDVALVDRIDGGRDAAGKLKVVEVARHG